MKNLILFFLMFGSLHLWSQIKGKITYKVSLDKSKIEQPYENPGNTEAMNEALEMLHESKTVDAYLVFNDSIALYYAEDKEEIPKWSNVGGAITIKPSSINMNWYLAGGENQYFSDWSRNYNIYTSKAKGEKRRIIKDSISWVITEETKVIEGYLCHKATIETKENRVAWFTKEIPLQHGPRGFNGLPGLVLEFQNNKYSYLVSSIELDHSEAENITEPLEGTLISEAEFRKWSQSIMSGN